MYADRQPRAGLNVSSLAIAVGINGGLVAALLLASPTIRNKVLPPPLIVESLPIDPIPPEPALPEPRPQPDQRTRSIPDRIEATKAPVPSDGGYAVPYAPPLPPLPPQPGTEGEAIEPAPPPPLPVMVDAAVDPSAAFQPDYPPSERRAEREGIVRIRVLIGTNGRVKQVERVSADSDAFWRATERQAATRWRFRPATRGGDAVEQWRTFTVRFRLES